MFPMKNLLLLHHPKIPHSLELAQRWANELQQLGARAAIISAWDEPEIVRQTAHAQLAITLGGDGTLLRAARACAPAGVPILGVNFGRVGFMSEWSPDQFDARAVIDGKYWIEERMMLYSLCTRGGKPLGEFEALNDIVVGRGKLARVIRLATFIDGDYLKTFVADGAIVATATGSTAYVFAAGGPILAPDVKTLVLVPIAPYLSQLKSLVLPVGSRVLFHLETDHNAILTVDGQIDLELQNGDEILVQASKHVALFARFQPRTYFYSTLVDRLRERSPERGENNRNDGSK
jgi:NAD+ kinase